MSDSKKATKKIGLPPGSLVHVGDQKIEKTKISLIDYDSEAYSELECKNVSDSFPFKENPTVTWVNIDGLHNTKVIADLGQYFGLHPLLLEDILNTEHRPKTEEFENYIFLVLKMVGISKERKITETEQVSFILGAGWVISLQEKEGDLFDVIRTRLREKKGNMRSRGSDFLLYRLLDTVVDNYFFTTEHFSEEIERLEQKVLANPVPESLLEIQRMKKQITAFRKSVSPLREAVLTLQKGDLELIHEGTLRYLQDVYEHIIQVIDSIETQRDMMASIMDLYLSGVSNRMNQVMQVLTIMATIFIPLTFIAGIYGMNFDHMPELHYRYGYFAVWGLMIAVTIVMIFYFRRKKWL